MRDDEASDRRGFSHRDGATVSKRVGRYSAAAAADSRPVSRAHLSTLLQRHTEDRPSFPSGFGKPGPPASTFTRCGEIPSRLAMSTAITSSVRESTSTVEP